MPVGTAESPPDLRSLHRNGDFKAAPSLRFCTCFFSQRTHCGHKRKRPDRTDDSVLSDTGPQRSYE